VAAAAKGAGSPAGAEWSGPSGLYKTSAGGRVSLRAPAIVSGVAGTPDPISRSNVRNDAGSDLLLDHLHPGDCELNGALVRFVQLQPFGKIGDDPGDNPSLGLGQPYRVALRETGIVSLRLRGLWQAFSQDVQQSAWPAFCRWPGGKR